jgi:hypothetical protein
MSADGLWSIHLQNCRLFGPALGMRRAEALPAWPLSSSHKVVPHRRLLMRAVASDIFDADQSMVPKLSIGVPVFNGQELLPELLDSLLLEENPDIILAHTGTAFIDEESEILPFEQETGSSIDPKTRRRYWPDVPSFGDTPVAINRFWQVLTRARGGSHVWGYPSRKSCSKRLSCPISPAVIARCWQNWLCLAVSGKRAIVFKTLPCQRFLGS